MTARAVVAGWGRRPPIPPPNPLQCIRGVCAILAALAVLATPVQCSLAMGAHSLFVDPRDMMAMMDGPAGHRGHAGHANHAHAMTATAPHHEAAPQAAPAPASVLPRVARHPDATSAPHPAGQALTKESGSSPQSSQVDLPTLKQFSGFVDAASPVVIGSPTLALSSQWAPSQARSTTEDELQPFVTWAESPPP